jgi:hypothetical protein
MKSISYLTKFQKKDYILYLTLKNFNVYESHRKDKMHLFSLF